MVRYVGKQAGLALLAAAVLLRLLQAVFVPPEPEQAARLWRQAAAMASGTCAAAAETEAEPELWVVRKTAAPAVAEQPMPAPAPEEAPSREKLTFTREEAEAIAIGGACTYNPDKKALLLRDAALSVSADGPTVLIVHTHTSEAYTQSAGWFYQESDRLRTTQPDCSVVRVGAEIAGVLEQAGIAVIHDTSYNDYPDYNGSYTRTGEKIQAWLEQYPTIRVVLDVHRDAVENADGTPRRDARTLSDGRESARLMLVVGTDQGGTRHPNWQDNLSLALKAHALVERAEPGLCRNIDLRTERFNQHLSPGYLLVEVGSTGNTMPEALAAGAVFAEALAKLLLSP